MNKYIKTLQLVAVLCSTIALQGCIENDIPYPRIQAQILSIEAQGLASPAIIDNELQQVTLVMADTIDLSRVNITAVTLTEGAKASPAIVGIHDLTNGQKFTLSIYQDYEWEIIATQEIEYDIAVKGQVGVPSIEPHYKRARIFVNENIDLSQIEFTSFRLGPEGYTTYSPAIDQLHDFSKGPRQVTVSYHNIEESWTIYVVHTASRVTLSSVDAWTRVAWLYGSGLEENNNLFEIREASSEQWTEVPLSNMISRGSYFVARVGGLKPNTQYVARAFFIGDAGQEVSNEITFTTEGEVELPNGGFNDWWKNGNIWNPWLEGGTQWWDTGNPGAATLGDSNSVPTNDAVEGMAAMLQTRFVGIGAIGKMAAGNIFVGKFGKVDGTNGIIHLGQPFNHRPTKLKGYYKYQSGPIDQVDESTKELLGKPDSMSIYIALGDWDEPVEIRTNPKNRKLFDVNDPHIIAYASLATSDNVDQYTPFELELDYRSTSRVPNYIIVIASSSKLGDFFTGSTQSTLYVDEFSLEWDY